MFILQKTKIIFIQTLVMLVLQAFFKPFLKRPRMVAFTKLSLRGLGYRSFIDQSNLYLLLGMSHYYKLRVPNKIFLAKRRQTLFLWSTSPSQITSFVIKLRQLRSLSFYKEKGVLPNVEWSGFLKPRVTVQK